MFRVFLFSILVASSSTSLQPEPYCDRNVTEIITVPVQRTRQIIVKPSIWKFWKKETTRIVIDFENENRTEFRVKPGCCEGFYMTAQLLCEPICEHGCPAFANCVEPNLCRCKAGYISAISPKEGCEPICATKCPNGMMCVAPNKCECQVGYRWLEDDIGQCVPTCKAGDGCQNGNCVGVEQCVCHKNYKWEPKLDRCEKLIPVNSESGEEIIEEIDYIGDTFDTTSLPSTTVDDNDFNEDKSFAVTECPAGFLLYKGQCRTELFSSAETDCNFSSCGSNQICLSNGTCTCAEDHIPQNSTFTNGQPSTELVCLHYLLDMNAVIEPTATKFHMNTTMICLIGFITICVAVILALLVVKLLMRRKGRLDVEARTKANLECEYTNKISDDSNEWVP